MAHLGTISSFAVRPDRPAWPGCYASMNKVWSLQTVERFALRCRHIDDLSPCPARVRGAGRRATTSASNMGLVVGRGGAAQEGRWEGGWRDVFACRWWVIGDGRGVYCWQCWRAILACLAKILGVAGATTRVLRDCRAVVLAGWELLWFGGAALLAVCCLLAKPTCVALEVDGVYLC